ncbi:hypothetical protein F5882DRAFT_437935 [Hyaloscypha sp. PMI_1271]|nr:hypothetical protein F5882DRAFT_437935 [Hyaloscypha sp. PMI_1271]
MASGSSSEDAESVLRPGLLEEIVESVTKRVTESIIQTIFFDEGESRRPYPPSPSGADYYHSRPSSPTHRGYSSRPSSPPSSPSRMVYTPPSPMDGPVKMHRPTSPTPSTRRGSEFSSSAPGPEPMPLNKPNRSPDVSRAGASAPVPGRRTYSDTELSDIDQKWGNLFSDDGCPTARLSEFLRGIANYLNDEYPPKGTIAITPQKMVTFYTMHGVEKELDRHLDIFRTQDNMSLSLFYQGLGCQQVLMQENARMRPEIPALTNIGFAHWMTLTILAYPEIEARRLQSIVLKTPINADGVCVDGKPERLPEQISRYLLPSTADPTSLRLLEESMLDLYEHIEESKRGRS